MSAISQEIPFAPHPSSNQETGLLRRLLHSFEKYLDRRDTDEQEKTYSQETTEIFKEARKLTAQKTSLAIQRQGLTQEIFIELRSKTPQEREEIIALLPNKDAFYTQYAQFAKEKRNTRQ